MSHTFFSLDSKVAVITGGGSGIGRSIAQVFARAGGTVWIADIDETGGHRTRDMIREQGHLAEFVACDVTRRDTMTHMVDAVIDGSSRIDILVNNAGVGFVGDVLHTPEADFDRLMNVNVKGIYIATQCVLPKMLEAGQGHIINMASIASLIGIKDRFVYCATKGAVQMMTKSIALDYVDRGIRCNCICPTRIHTPFVDDYLRKNYPGHEQEMFEKLSAYQPIGRMGTPEEVAFLALYLASDEGRFHTGESFPIVGGKLMG